METYGIDKNSTTVNKTIYDVNNPRSGLIMERNHFTMGDIPRTDNFIGLHW